MCLIPGPAGNDTYPYSFSSYDVCGGAPGVTELLLQDGQASRLGSVQLFRDFSSLLYITVTLGTAGARVPLYLQEPSELPGRQQQQ